MALQTGEFSCDTSAGLLEYTHMSKQAFVVGASGGIGAAVVAALKSNGWGVFAHLGRGKSESATPTGLLGAFTGDITEWAADPASLPQIPPVDAVIWCAGICELAPGQLLRPKPLRRVLAINLEAPLVVLSTLYRKGLIRDGGKVIAIGSEAAHSAGEGFAMYAASKGGLASALRVLQTEFARRQVAVHCLEPGTVNTPMTQQLLATFGGLQDGHEASMVEPETIAGQVIALLPKR
jgi:NAD(P)-dependent dehydrogenase (short-subunit alcohol dehydrogenase family)